MPNFYVENFGCRAARSDGEAVSARLRSQGMTELTLAEADLVVINTCSVTAEADREARAFIRKTTRLNPLAKVIVTGCYAQRAPAEIAALTGVSAVVGNSHKGMVPEIVQSLLAPQTGARASTPQLIPATNLLAPTDNASIWADESFAHSEIENAQVFPGAQTRPNLKIQEGCSNRCTFCIIPTTRGFSRSMTFTKVLAQVNGFIAADGKELVLSGINLGRWGRDLARDFAPNTLAALIRTILETTSLPRLRLSSIEPMDWTPELISLLREYGATRFARHAHLPLQSGSDAVLRRMHRRYRPWHYAEKIDQIVAAAGPEVAIGADVMVGFPGETKAEFLETYNFIASLPFTYLHLFPFSARPGTPGWQLHQQSPVPSQAVHERMAALQSLIAEKSKRFRNGLMARTLPAVTLNTPAPVASNGRTTALTDNYLPIQIQGSFPANQLFNVQITSILDSGILLGETHLPSRSEPRELAVAI